MPRPQRRTVPTSIIDAPNLTLVRENPRQRRVRRCHVQRHLLLASIDLTSVHAVQRGAASRFIALHATERIG